MTSCDLYIHQAEPLYNLERHPQLCWYSRFLDMSHIFTTLDFLARGSTYWNAIFASRQCFAWRVSFLSYVQWHRHISLISSRQIHAFYVSRCGSLIYHVPRGSPVSFVLYEVDLNFSCSARRILTQFHSPLLISLSLEILTPSSRCLTLRSWLPPSSSWYAGP